MVSNSGPLAVLRAGFLGGVSLLATRQQTRMPGDQCSSDMTLTDAALKSRAVAL